MIVKEAVSSQSAVHQCRPMVTRARSGENGTGTMHCMRSRWQLPACPICIDTVVRMVASDQMLRSDTDHAGQNGHQNPVIEHRPAKIETIVEVHFLGPSTPIPKPRFLLSSWNISRFRADVCINLNAGAFGTPPEAWTCDQSAVAGGQLESRQSGVARHGCIAGTWSTDTETMSISPAIVLVASL